MLLYVFWIFLVNILIYQASSDESQFSKDEIKAYRDKVEEMFYHAYNGYMEYAFPYDELRPLTCDGHDTWGSYSLTLIDALDTLAVMGNKSEFVRVVDIISQRNNFDIDINVSVFETNIRIVGGLLGGHLLMKRMGAELNNHWPCQGKLLDLAIDAANRLLPAFDTPTGMPYGTVNLRHGVPDGETPITCVAAVGTYLIEFGTLSRLTGDPIYEQVATRAMYALWQRRSTLGLLGNHIDVLRGQWTAHDSGIGAGVDSYFEYLVKGAYLFQKPDLMKIFQKARYPIEKYLRHEDWYVWATMQKAQVTLAVFQSLEAFWPGILTLVGDVEDGKKLLLNYHQVWKQFGFTPEFYNIPHSRAYTKREGYPLRPELVESMMYVYQVTKDHIFLRMGADVIESINHSARTKCGYATVKNVNDHSLDNRMESFFLAETAKYLYLLFDEDNFLHNNGNTGTPFSVNGRHCMLDTGYFFNTEAHPIDVGSIKCCTGPKSPDNIVDEDTLISLLFDPSNSTVLYSNENLNEEKLPVTIKPSNESEEIEVTVTSVSDDKEETSTESSVPRIIPPAETVKEVFSIDKLREKLSTINLNYTESFSLLSCPSPSFQSIFSYRGQTFSER